MQNDIVRAENTLYPFTDNNPYDSWLKRLRIRWLGETTAEILERKRLIAFAHSDYEQIRVKGIEAATSVVNSTVNSTTNSPLLPGLGLPLPKPLTSGHVVWSATSSNANSPSIAAVGLPAVESTLKPTLLSPFPTATEISLSKAPSVPTPGLVASENAWDVSSNLPDSSTNRATSYASRIAKLVQRRRIEDSPELDTRSLDYDGTPLDVPSLDTNANRIPLESSID
jgi:hypothetical protein